jgi:hypothetical protein
MKEQCIITKVPITLKGELRTFQIKIPRTAMRIIGIETGIVAMKYNDSEYARNQFAAQAVQAQAAQAVQASPAIKVPGPVPVPAPGPQSLFMSTLVFRPELLIGELKLRSLEKANIFYIKDVHEADLSMMFGDFSITPGFIPQNWTHGRHRLVDPVVVNGETTVIQGLFKDRLGERIGKDWPYAVNVYVWYEINDSHDSQPCS